MGLVPRGSDQRSEGENGPGSKEEHVQTPKVIVEKPDDGLELKCRARGTPEPSVTWTLNGRKIDAESKR